MATTERWMQVRTVLKAHRHELTHVAGRLYPECPRVAGAGLLGRPEWLPSTPVPLGRLRLSFASHPPPPAVDGTGPVSAHLRPGGGRYGSYAAAVADLDPPALLENRACYRLLGAALSGGDGHGGAAPELRLALTRYFDAVSLGHAAAHELAAAWHEAPGQLTLDRLPLRAFAGDPTDLPRRPALVAITTLTLRKDTGGASFVLHWRDPARVNHAGGLYQVMPVGVFQPLADGPAAVANDLSLWRCLAREFSEEFLGGSEEYPAGAGGVLDYGAWPFYQRLSAAAEAGKLAVYCLGAGVDPLTFATDLLTVAVLDAGVFDDLFGGLVRENAEGRVIGGPGAEELAFDAGTVARVTGGSLPLQASGAAVLRLAWQHRGHLLRPG